MEFVSDFELRIFSKKSYRIADDQFNGVIIEPAVNRFSPRHLFRPALFFLMACAGFCAVALQIDPGGDLPSWPEGPGLTLDEGFNAEEGVRLAAGLKAWVQGTLTWQEVFGKEEQLGANPPLGYHLADHPPLGRIWMGVWHEGCSKVLAKPGDSSRVVVVAYARLGSASAFGLLLFLVGFSTARWYGTFAGVVAALSLLLMPRVFGHAHLAALETMMNLIYTAAILSVAAWWKSSPGTSPSPPRFLAVVLAGFLWGLALLTKIQAVLIGPPVVLWALWHWRWRAIFPLLVWGLVGLTVFFAGWPWLWFDPRNHALDYFRSTTNRATLYAWYFGERYADVNVPWHYPFVMFLTTIPVGLLLLGFCGIFGRETRSPAQGGDGRLPLLVAAGMFPLVLFAVPGVAVYDGERLFLVSFPLFAIPIGLGTAMVWRWLTLRWNAGRRTLVLMGFLLLQTVGLWTLSPCYLSYYNLLIGGVPGGNELGMETNSWGDSLTRTLWEEVVRTVPKGSTVHVTPVVHPLQLAFLDSQLPELKAKQITLAPCIPERTDEATYLVLFERQADLAPEIVAAVKDVAPQFAITRQGVRLGAFYNFGPTSE